MLAVFYKLYFHDYFFIIVKTVLLSDTTKALVWQYAPSTVSGTRILVYSQNKMQTHRVSWQWGHDRWLTSFVTVRSLVEGTVNTQAKPRWPFMQIFSKTRNPSIIYTKQFLLLWYSITGHRFNLHLVFLSFVKNLVFLYWNWECWMHMLKCLWSFNVPP